MTLDTKALEAAARAVDSSWFDGGPEFQDTESSYKAHCLDTARAAIEAYLSATPSRNDILEEARFLVERLEEYETGIECDDDAREFYGHVSPSAARLRALVKP